MTAHAIADAFTEIPTSVVAPAFGSAGTTRQRLLLLADVPTDNRAHHHLAGGSRGPADHSQQT